MPKVCVDRGVGGGVDGVVNQDHLSLIGSISKRSGGKVRLANPSFKVFVGALAGVGASKGVIMTTSSFAQSAVEFANNLTDQKLSLLTGNDWQI